MKNFLLILFSFHVILVFGQIDAYEAHNKKRLEILNQKIDENILLKDFQKIVSLEKEKELRNRLDYAYSKNAPAEQIVLLKNELLHCDCISENKEQEIEELQESLKRKNKQPLGRENIVFYSDVLAFNFYNTANNHWTYPSYYGPYYYTTYNPAPVLKRAWSTYLTMGFKIGASFYFSKYSETNKFRVGFDLCFFSFTYGSDLGTLEFPPLPDMILLNFPQPGIVLNKKFNRFSGIEVKTNFGISRGYGFNITGVNGRFSLNYNYKKFAVGIEYQYTTSIYYKFNATRVHQFGLTLGARF